MAEIDKIKVKIFNLLQKTVENGCTEAEAMAAARKAGQLMDHYQLSMTDIQIRNSECVTHYVSTHSVNRSPIDSCVMALARYCDVKIWFSKGDRCSRSSSRYGVFGLKSDTELFDYLFNVIRVAMDSELKKFQRTDNYRHLPKGHKLSATKSFLRGMASGISHKLNAMKEERRRDVEVTGRDLVVVKDSLIKEEWKKTGIKLSKVYTSTRVRDFNAHSRGYEKGKNLALNPGVRGGNAGGFLE